VDVYESMDTIGCSITLTTNHRAESQCIVDNACRISRQEFPIPDPVRNFHIIRLPNDDESLTNGQFRLILNNKRFFYMLLCEITARIRVTLHNFLLSICNGSNTL